MSKQKALFLVATAAVVIKLIYDRKRQTRDGQNFIPKSLLAGGTEEAIALLQPALKQAALEARNLSGLGQDDQLMLYGLYKQATMGDVNISTPSKFRMTAYAKYQAWAKFKGMPQHFAILKYVEVVSHFSKLKETGDLDSNKLPKDNSSSMANFSMISGESHADIEYEEDQDYDGEDLSDDGEEREDMKTLSHHKDDELATSLGTKQSTLLQGPDDMILSEDGTMTPLHAATLGNPILLQKCIDKKMDTNVSDENGQTPLHMAADKDSVDCIMILLKNGANINAADNEGTTPLHAAVIRGSVDVTKTLLENGGNPDLKDEDGESPRSYAMDDDCEQMKKLFSQLIHRNQ